VRTYRDSIADAIEAIEFESSHSFRWFGSPGPAIDAKISRLWLPEHFEEFLALGLQTYLYERFYCSGGAVANVGPPTTSEPTLERRLLHALMDANCGRGGWETGWQLCSETSNRLAIRGHGLESTVEPVAARPTGDDMGLGAEIELRRPKHSLAGSPGYYVALSDRSFEPESQEDVVRIYLNLRLVAAPTVMRRLTRTLNGRRIPFHFKVLTKPDAYHRCDSGVLYIPRSSISHALLIVEAIYPRLVRALKPGTPTFTKQLAPGLGLAEDPTNGDSFGLDRCRLLAKGLIRARDLGQSKLADRFDTVSATFAEAGIDLIRPYLNAASEDNYRFRVSLRVPPIHSVSRTGPDALIHLAEGIATRICNESIWYKDQCTWLSIAPLSLLPDDQTGTTVLSPVGTDLYSGVSGIALFLAEMYRATGHETFRRTALGATEHAMTRHLSRAPQLGGLFTGLAGEALAFARIGLLLSRPALVRRALDLVPSSCETVSLEREFDLMSGSAGSIVALLGLHRLAQDGVFLHAAMKLADDLCAKADRSERGWSWKSYVSVTSHNLTGMSHGSAGIALALSELASVTGTEEYFMAAAEALRYERSWYDAETGNWPNFLDDPESGYTRFLSQWCHGAPGIGLSRLRIFRLFGEETAKQEAFAALSTTRRTIKEWLNSGDAGFSLCHGLAGNADVLHYASEVFGSSADSDDEGLAHAVAAYGRSEYSHSARHWAYSSGTEHPGLMLGLAGIGHFYLRLSSQLVPSILIVEPERFVSQL